MSTIFLTVLLYWAEQLEYKDSGFVNPTDLFSSPNIKGLYMVDHCYSLLFLLLLALTTVVT